MWLANFDNRITNMNVAGRQAGEDAGRRTCACSGTASSVRRFPTQAFNREKAMGRIIKALILGWFGKKIYDRVAADEPADEASKEKPAKAVPQAKRAAPKRTARKPARRAA
jgi:hypothetical protein